MNGLSLFLRDSEAAGMYLLDTAIAVVDIEKEVERCGYAFFYLEGEGVLGKEQFLGQIARAMDFPDYFGGNWDALEDCLTDLSWREAPGYVILYDHFDVFAEQVPDQFETALEILDASVEFWRTQGRPLFVMLRGKGGPEWGLKLLSF
ncbi:MAG: barstar family protein [Gammaproteobacteria bacterium]